MLKVKLFGPGQALYNDLPVIRFPHQQPCLVLCYLLLSPYHPIHRDQLAAVFWADYPAQTARKHLRNTLWRLKQWMESVGIPSDDYLMVSDEFISFINASPFWLDTQVFEKAALSFQDIDGDHLHPEQASALDKAVELYTGDMLEGVYEDWCLYERERLHLLFLNSLNKLMAYHEKYGQYERGLAYGERILTRDNTREKVHLQMMRFHWLLGDKPSALAQYRRCSQILHDELNTQPMKETTLIYQQMLNNQFMMTPAHEKGQPTIENSAPEGNPALAGTAIAEQVLIRLHKLQAVIEETQAEIRQLEMILNQAALNSKNGL